jgi:hypothetical protein
MSDGGGDGEGGAATGGGHLPPLSADQQQLKNLVDARLKQLKDGASTKPPPAAGKGKEVSPCWQFFTCVDYKDKPDQHSVMCIVRDTAGDGTVSICGTILQRHPTNSTSNYVAHLSKSKTAGHVHAHLACQKGSARSASTKGKKQLAATGQPATTSGDKGLKLALPSRQIVPHMRRVHLPQASKAQMQAYRRHVVLFSALDLRPCSVDSGDGYQLLVGNIAPAFAGNKLHTHTFDKELKDEYVKLKDAVVDALRNQHKELRGQPFCCLQLDLTTETNRSWLTMSVSFMNADFEFERLTLVNREFPLDHKAAQVAAFIVEVSQIAVLIIIFAFFQL